jgi:hypothetical protein
MKQDVSTLDAVQHRDWLTFGLAVWGGATGTVAVLVAAASYVRDRPRVDVSANVSFAPETNDAQLRMVVANHGRQPISLETVGVRVAAKNPPLEVMKANKGQGYDLFRAASETPIRLQPGEVRNFTRDLTAMPIVFHVDTPLRPFAEDSRSRVAWGPAEPYLRELVLMGWRPPKVFRDELLSGVTTPVEIEPIAARWKFWVPGYLRRKRAAH